MSFLLIRCRPWLMWLIPLLFFAYQFILRLWPSLTMQEIMAKFSIDATQFGILSAMYYIGYAGMQIPVAILLDRFSVKAIISLFMVIGSVSSFIFTTTDSWTLALVGRFLVGFASSIGFLGTAKVISLWFPKSQYGYMIGLTFSFGLLGAVYGGYPLNFMIETLGSTGTGKIISAVGILLSLLSFAFLSHPPQSAHESSDYFTLQDFKEVIRNPAIITLSIINFLMVGALEGFADIWGVQFIMTSYHIPKDTSAALVTMIYLGMLFGGPLLARVSQRIGGPYVILISGIAITFLFILILFQCSLLTPFILRICLFLVGIFCCYQVVIFATSEAYVKSSVLGLSVAFLNCINMLGGSFFHSVIGRLMDIFWDHTLQNGCPLYTPQNYKVALSIIPIAALMGGLLALKIRRPS